jgi:hypothetical protein
MKSLSKLFLLAASLLIISSMTGCASNFVRPQQDAIVLGKSTIADVEKISGKSSIQPAESTSNGEKVKSTTYFYNESAKFWGLIIPWRSMSYVTHNDVVVGESFNSTMDGESTQFPLEKVSMIVRGKSTKADVIELLGKPSGTYIYPVSKKGNTGIAYLYNYARFAGILTSPNDYRVLVELDGQNVVADISYKKDGKEQLAQ